MGEPDGGGLVHDTAAYAAVRTALRFLPERCPYHGNRLFWSETTTVRTAITRPDDPCCESGRPALARKMGLAAAAVLLGERDTARAGRDKYRRTLQAISALLVVSGERGRDT